MGRGGCRGSRTTAGLGASPDGRRLAYESTEDGRTEVVVRSFPDGESRLQLSSGGLSPVWSRSGDVLYHTQGAIVSVAARGSTITASKPGTLLHTGGETGLAPVFDVTPDGSHLLMLRSRGSEYVSLILDWPRELVRLEAESKGERP